ncbi:MAG TPA: nicotinamide-nucleotide amidohydrolase family protein [Caldimonas sp.]|nr:nicotinamide-nucleotide amidohydrolase family protein [Caldimonas sp.]
MSTHTSAGVAALVARLGGSLRGKGATMAAAESCTGGLIAAACTSLAGSSDWFERGFVTYSNAAKIELLSVPDELIARHGAVSEEVARAMAEGALAHSRARFAVAATGIAGPGGGTLLKPVGTVWIAVASTGSAAHASLLRLHGERDSIRQASVIEALSLLAEHVDRS